MKKQIKQLLRESLLSESTSGGEYNVFHGSENNITKFTDDFVGGNEATDQNGPGIYFTTSEEEAYRYGKNLYKVILSPRILFDETKINKIKIRPYLKKLSMMADDWKGTAQNWNENPSIGLQNFIEGCLDNNDNEKDCLLQVWFDFYRYGPIDFVKNCVKLGIDGIKVTNRADGVFFNDESTHFIIYNPNIIKLG